MKFNKLLTNSDRDYYKKLIGKMYELSPEMMSRKIPLANVQQAFVLDAVGKFMEEGLGSSILCVGSFEDTAFDCLLRKGIVVTGIDPDINHDLHTFINSDDRNKRLFSIVFSTSVIEHVVDDIQFIADICSILQPGGVGILTCDFNNNYRCGDRLPATDVRFYTERDLMNFGLILKENNCALVDNPDWSGEPDFTHDECNYSFATYVFRKHE
jgi:hypothetical protein